MSKKQPLPGTIETIDQEIAYCKTTLDDLGKGLKNAWNEPMSDVRARLATAEDQTKRVAARLKALRAERARLEEAAEKRRTA